MTPPTIYADFHNADRDGRLRLSCKGTFEDLERTGLVLSEGMRLNLSDDELAVEGVVQFSVEERLWVAVIDWDAICDVPVVIGSHPQPAV